MNAPLVPGTDLGGWTIVHECGDVISGSRGSLAFTTRAAFDTWARGVVVLKDDDWLYGPPKSVLNAEIALLTPNRYVLILEEAWGWKFLTQCPPMHSAEDGQAVLEELLSGECTQEQKFFLDKTWIMAYSLYERQDPVRLFITAWQERLEWEEYRALEHWEPDAVIGPGGMVLFLRAVDCDYVTLVNNRGSFRASLRGGTMSLSHQLPEDEELMVIEEVPSCNDLWSPQSASRESPAYLARLT